MNVMPELQRDIPITSQTISAYLCCLCSLFSQVCHFTLQSLILHYSMNRVKIFKQWYQLMAEILLPLAKDQCAFWRTLRLSCFFFIHVVITVTSEVALLLQGLLQTVHCDKKALSLYSQLIKEKINQQLPMACVYLLHIHDI